MPLTKGIYKRQAPYADVPETLGLRGAQKQPKIAENGQRWPQEGENQQNPSKSLNKLGFWAKLSQRMELRAGEIVFS